MTARGLEIGRFICRLAEKEKLPRTSWVDDHPVGGIAALGWSLGNAFGFSLMANLQLLSPSDAKLLNQYLHTYIAFGG